MNVSQKFLQGLVFAFAIDWLCCAVARAEDKPTVASAAPAASTSSITAAPGEEAATLADPQSQTTQSQTTQSQATQSQTTSVGFASSGDQLSDNKWHLYSTAYIWFPGIHAEVGVHGFTTSVHLNAGDIFSNFRGGFVGAFIPTYNRFSVPMDFMWLRLKPSDVIPHNPDYSVTATLNMILATPKVAYLMVNNPKFKIYGNMGPRIWHVGTSLTVVPEIQGYNPSVGVTWTDFVAGGRFSVPLGSKASVDFGGDAGEGGATLDYQIQGFVSYQLKPKLSLQGGWRYLTAHYGNNGNLFNGTIQGIVLGATYQFK